MSESQLFQNHDLIKIYGVKNRAASIMGVFAALLLSYVLFSEINHILQLFKTLPHFSLSRNISRFKLMFIGFGILAVFVILLISYVPNVLINEKQIRIGWKFGGAFGLTYRHLIPWDHIVQIDSGGSKLIQWSPNTSIFYHTGKVPLGYSSDVAEAVISRRLGRQNYCKILTIVLQKAPKAKVDALTLRLMKGCENSHTLHA